MYRKIIVPLDGSELAEQILPYARGIALAFEIPVELLYVEDPDQIIPHLHPRQVSEYLQRVSAQYLSSSLRLNLAVESGRPAEVIVDRARADPGSLLAMATHGLSGIQRWIIGSVASKIIQSAANPLLLVHPNETDEPARLIQLKRLLVPLDGSGLAAKVLPHVIALAQKLNLEVDLVQVYGVPVEASMVGDGLYMNLLGRQRETVEKEIENYLDGKCEELKARGLSRVSSIAVRGEAAAEIIDLAHRTPNCLIAMSTHGRSGVNRWVLGSIAEKVIHHSKAPVLMVRPE